MGKRLLVILIIFSISCCAQKSDSLTFNKIDEHSELIDQHLNKKIFLVGDKLYDGSNEAFSLLFLKYLNQNNIFPEYILLERTHGAAVVLNEYLKTGNEKFLEALTFYYPSNTASYKEYREYYLKLDSLRKFTFVGVDCDNEYDLMFMGVQLLLFKDSAFLYNVESWQTDTTEHINILNCFKYNSNPMAHDVGQLKGYLNDLSILMTTSDSIIVKSIARKNYEALKLAIACYEFSKKRKFSIVKSVNDQEKNMDRESFVANNIYRLYCNDTLATVYGKFGSEFVQPGIHFKNKNESWHTPMSQLLNKRNIFPITNNKISCNVILDEYSLKCESDFLNLEYGIFKRQYDSIQNNRMFCIEGNKALNYCNLFVFKIKQSPH